MEKALIKYLTKQAKELDLLEFLAFWLDNIIAKPGNREVGKELLISTNCKNLDELYNFLRTK